MNAALLWSLVPYLVPLLFPMVVAIAAFLYMSLMQRLPMQQRLIVSSMAHSVVAAIEQMVPESSAGSQKKDQAMAWLQALLSASRISVPAQFLEVAIEAAVFELHALHPSTAQNAGSSDPEEPFPWRPTLRSLPAVQPTAPLNVSQTPTSSTNDANTNSPTTQNTTSAQGKP
jgi:thioesterase domain-containing protein